MQQEQPRVTVIIAARPGQLEVQAIAASRALHYPAGRLEILVARGKQPSAQRNMALQAATGEWIYFLDDDSICAPDNLEKLTGAFGDPALKVVGGPNLCPPEAPWIEQVFALVLSSWLAFGPSRARYSRVGQRRESSEKELILCNLIARRLPLLELGGFNEALYPNEENALMDELQKRGGKLVYDPDFYVHRRPRSNLRSFTRMLLTYGRGRAEQFRLHPGFGSLLNFVPPVFCVFLMAMPWLGNAGLWLLGFYWAVVLTQGLVSMRSGRLLAALASLPLIFLTHVLYGAGFWRGLFTTLRTKGDIPRVAVTLEKIQ